MKLTMRSLYSVGCLLALTLVTAVLASPTGQSKSLFGRKPGDYIIQRDDNNRQTVVGDRIVYMWFFCLYMLAYSGWNGIQGDLG